MIVGYITGVFDLFHIGHLNLLRRANARCGFLIVGVSTDDVVLAYKHRAPIIPFAERIEIVKSIKYADHVIPRRERNIVNECLQQKANRPLTRVFIGDDWKGTPIWDKAEEDLGNIGVEVFWLPYTKHISTTIIREKIHADS